MLKNMKSDYMSWTILIGIVVLLLEVSFFNSGLIFSLFISAAMIYIGRKYLPKKRGKLLFWGGLFFLVASIFSMITFRFFLIAILINFVIQFVQSKRKPKYIIPVIKTNENEDKQEMMVRSRPLFENIFFGQQKTPSQVYEWNDVNIQSAVGDTVIDLSYTVLPKGETVIFIRNLIGNVQVLVPYELEVSISHSVITGSTSILESPETKVFNHVLQLQTPDFEKAEQKVKIITSLVFGDLEVKRI
jgi:lia operon protein LiaF